jgi:starvation-inducible DNA-binding protein
MSHNNSSPAVVEALSHLLADNYTLYLKTQNFHWNVTGPHFLQLHTLFQTQYEELAAANDEIAERIRALGHKAPGSFAAFAKLASVKEEDGSPDWKKMLEALAADQDKICDSANKALKCAEEVGDEPTIDMMIGRLSIHQKNKWMLQAHLA